MAILMTCHNRREVTLECLRRLKACVVPDGFSFDIWLNDDGSTDRTGGAVVKWAIESPPVALYVVKGTGRDYWCGGMRRAWNAALESGTHYEGFIWLNADAMLFENALLLLLEPQDGIVVGAVPASVRR